MEQSEKMLSLGNRKAGGSWGGGGEGIKRLFFFF